MDQLTGNGSAIVNIDLMFAIILVMGAVTTAILIMPTLSHQDRDWRIKQYMTAVRATDNLVQDQGESGWETNWISGNYSNVIKIGLLYVDENSTVKQKVLDLIKIETFLGPGYSDTITETTWWEFPNSTTSQAERENAAKALGLEGYNFYMQLHPVGLDFFNSTPLETNLTDVVSINFDTVSVVDRYVYIVNPANPDIIKYIKYNNESIHYRLNLWVW